MAVEDRVRAAIYAELHEQRERLCERNEAYDAAKKFCAKYGASQMKKYRSEFDAEVFKSIEGGARMREQELEAKIGGRLLLDFVFDGTCLYLPTGRQVPLEIELSDYIGSVLKEKAHAWHGLTAYRCSHYDRRILLLPEPISKTSVSARAIDIGLPLVANPKVTEEIATIQLTPTAIKYVLIPVREEHKEFFPPYKNEFELTTPQGNAMVWVTSRYDGKRGEGQGGYIQGCRRDGNFRKLFREMKLGADDKVIIEQKVPFQVYSMKKS